MPAATIQVLLTSVIITLTGLLLFMGVQVILILREVHRAAKRLNKKESATELPSIQQSTVSVLQQLIKNQAAPVTQIDADAPPKPTMFEQFSYETLSAQTEVCASSQDTFSHITAIRERGRQSDMTRVFHRSGKPLV